MKFSDISFKNKIFILLLLPLIGFLGFSVMLITQTYNTTVEMSALSKLTQLSITNSELVHELQKERGATAGFLGSKGQKFITELREQRQLTDDKLRALKSFLNRSNFEQTEVIAINRQIADELAKLESLRRKVNNLDVASGTAIGYYTNLNAKMLSVATLIADISTDSELTEQILAYYSFLQGKERAGIERAVMSNIFALDKFTGANFVRFISLVTAQETYMANFLAMASEESAAFYQQQLNHDAVKEVERMRDVAKTKSEQFDIDAVHWFKQATLRIGQLKSVENKLAEQLLIDAKEKQDFSQLSLLIDIIVTIALLVLVTIICYISIKDLMSRVNELTQVMAKVRDENDLTVRTKLQGKSELGQISTALNLTLEQFGDAVKEISKSSLTLSAAAEETSTTCEINSQTMVEQQEGIGLIAAAIEQLSATVKEVASNTQLTADSAKEANSQAGNGLEVVQLAYSSIENLSREIDSLAERVGNLHNSSNNITQVVDVIKSVADQTNLLALNAAIEAARAGEHGRGFAVVADEVRTLAQRTQESTAEIENFISTLQADADLAYSVIEDSQKKAAEAVENSRNVENSLSEITNSVGNIFSMTDQIATAIEEQSVVTKDVAENVVNIEHKSTETTEGANQIAITAKEQTQLASSLQDLAGTFRI